MTGCRENWYTGNVSQVQGDFGTMSRRVHNLAQDRWGSAGIYKSSLTSQLGSNDRNMGAHISNIIQMLAGMLGGDKSQPVTRPQEVGVGGNQPAVVGSQGSPWP